MEGSIIRNKKFQFYIRLITAVAFTLFILYQIVLTIFVDANRVGRLVGIAIYLVITVATYLDFSERYKVWVAHSVMLVAGLLVLFGSKLFNLSGIIAYLNGDNPASVLNFIIYIIAQVGTLILVAGYLTMNADLENKTIKILQIVLMIVSIVLFIACFVLECVMMIKYRVNLDNNMLKPTLFSRVLYCVGYIGTAICFILPAPERDETDEEEPDESEFFSINEDKDDIDLVL